MPNFWITGLTACVLAAGLSAGNFNTDTVPKLIVTVEPHHGATAPTVTAADVQAYSGKNKVRVAAVRPLQGGPLDLYILIDDGANTNIGTQFGDLRKFIESQPPTTRIGLGYTRNGSARLVQDLTADHTLPAKALRLPAGGPGSTVSPYLAVIDLLKKWPATEARREVLLISSGLDLFNEPAPQNPDVNRCIHEAQRAGVLIYSILYGAEGHLGHSYWRMNWGENYLSQVSDETGGEAYWQGLQNPVSLAPYLDDLSSKLQLQYLVTLDMPPQKKAGLEPIKLRTELKGVEFLSSDKIWVPAGQ